MTFPLPKALPGDTATTLGTRVLAAECELHPATIREYAAAHPELFSSGEDSPL